MTDNKYIQVLWVEDNKALMDGYIQEADEFGDIELYPFTCWEDAEEALDSDYEKWDAIILDAKCCFKRGDADKAEKFLANVFPRIQKLGNIKKRFIPWYVLSGQGEDKIHDLIPEDIEWDASWENLTHRRFYHKSKKLKIGEEEKEERQWLFERIRLQVRHYRPDMQIENNLYPDVFHALDNLGKDMAQDVGYHLMPLLIPIHFLGTTNEDYNRRYMDLRKCLEYIFRDMVKKGILPSFIVSKNEKDGVYLSWSSLFLGGKQSDNLEAVSEKSEKRFWSKVERLVEAPLLPKQLGQWLKAAVFQTGGAVHTSEAEAEITMNLDKYLPNVGGSPYMLRSLTMGLCDFILWYDKLLKENPDEEMNAVKFWKEKSSKY